MGGYFLGWGRKLGVLTLLCSSTICGWWVRSLSTRDRLQVRTDVQTICSVESNLSRVTCIVMRERRELETGGSYGFWTTHAEPLDWFEGVGKIVYWRASCLGFEFGNLDFHPTQLRCMDGPILVPRASPHRPICLTPAF